MNILVLKGLPASGKTTYAKSLSGYKRISKDDLRGMLDDSRYSKSNERFILETRDNLIIQAIKSGHSVVVDDTNLNPIHIERIKEIGKQLAIDVVIKEFDTPLLECIERDKLRAKPVGEKVIRDMARRWMPIVIYDTSIKYPQKDRGKDYAYIVDFDGTLSTINGRSPYDYSKVLIDIPNYPIIDLVNNLYNTHTIIILSGRKEVALEDSKEWLKKHDVNYDKIFFRGDNDNRKDAVFKEEMLDKILKEYNVVGVFDDRQSVVDMWRRREVPCFQVNYGNF